MRTSTFFTVASVFLIGSYSLPQPEGLEASRTIEDREAHIGPGDPFPSHSGGAEWKHKHNSGGDPSVSNGTKIKERQAHHERPSSIPSGLAEFFEQKHHDGSGPGSSSTNSTKIKERQEHHGPPPGDNFTPPEGMTWTEYMKNMRHKGGSPTQGGSVPLSTGTSTNTDSSLDSSSSSTESNSTKVRMMKFRD